MVSIAITIYIEINELFVLAAPHLLMIITLNNKGDIVYSIFAGLIPSFHGRRYIFAAQSVWWLSVLIALSPALLFCLKHEQFPSELVVLDDCNNTGTLSVTLG